MCVSETSFRFISSSPARPGEYQTKPLAHQYTREPYDRAVLCQAVTTSATVSEAVTWAEICLCVIIISDPENRPLSP